MGGRGSEGGEVKVRRGEEDGREGGEEMRGEEEGR